jgi:hypothetical protein
MSIQLLSVKPIRRSYIIRNGRVGPEWKAVKPRTLSIAGRSILDVDQEPGIGDLYELYAFTKAQRHGLQPHLYSERFSDTSTQAFDPIYMTKLYDLASRWRATATLGRSSTPLGP